MLVAESKRQNLSSIRDPESIEKRHFAESLAFFEAIEAAGALGSPVIDVGTGGGFPGIPMKIARPVLELTLLEATGKKARFLEEVVSALQLDGVRVVNGRAEEVAHDSAYREQY